MPKLMKNRHPVDQCLDKSDDEEHVTPKAKHPAKRAKNGGPDKNNPAKKAKTKEVNSDFSDSDDEYPIGCSPTPTHEELWGPKTASHINPSTGRRYQMADYDSDEDGLRASSNVDSTPVLKKSKRTPKKPKLFADEECYGPSSSNAYIKSSSSKAKSCQRTTAPNKKTKKQPSSSTPKATPKDPLQTAKRKASREALIASMAGSMEVSPGNAPKSSSRPRTEMKTERSTAQRTIWQTPKAAPITSKETPSSRRKKANDELYHAIRAHKLDFLTPISSSEMAAGSSEVRVATFQALHPATPRAVKDAAPRESDREALKATNNRALEPFYPDCPRADKDSASRAPEMTYSKSATITTVETSAPSAAKNAAPSAPEMAIPDATAIPAPKTSAQSAAKDAAPRAPEMAIPDATVIPAPKTSAPSAAKDEAPRALVAAPVAANVGDLKVAKNAEVTAPLSTDQSASSVMKIAPTSPCRKTPRRSCAAPSYAGLDDEEEEVISSEEDDEDERKKEEEKKQKREKKERLEEQRRRAKAQARKARIEKLKEMRLEKAKAAERKKKKLEAEKEDRRIESNQKKDAVQARKKWRAAINKQKTSDEERKRISANRLRNLRRRANLQYVEERERRPNHPNKKTRCSSEPPSLHRHRLQPKFDFGTTPFKSTYWEDHATTVGKMQMSLQKAFAYAEKAANLNRDHYFAEVKDPYFKASKIFLEYAHSVEFSGNYDVDYRQTIAPEDAIEIVNGDWNEQIQSRLPSTFKNTNFSDGVLAMAKTFGFVCLRNSVGKLHAVESTALQSLDYSKRLKELRFFLDKYRVLLKLWKKEHEETPFPRVVNLFFHVLNRVWPSQLGRTGTNNETTHPQTEKARYKLIRDLVLWLPIHLGDCRKPVHVPRECLVGLARQMMGILLDEWPMVFKTMLVEERDMLYRMQAASLRLDCFAEGPSEDPFPYWKPVDARGLSNVVKSEREKHEEEHAASIEAFDLRTEERKRKAFVSLVNKETKMPERRVRRRHRSTPRLANEHGPIVEPVKPQLPKEGWKDAYCNDRTLYAK